MNDRQWLHSAFALAGLSTFFMSEGMSLLYLCWDTKKSGLPLSMTMDRRLSCSLMLLILFAQMVKNFLFATSTATWVHAAQLSEAPLTFRPVLSIHYVEWMVTVPLMLVLAGVCVLGRPFTEVIIPVIVTDMYIFLAWTASLVTSPSFRWLLVVMSFTLYGWASLGMFRWVSSFWRSESKDLPRPEIRAAIASGLVVLFALYGFVYLLAQLRAVSVVAEHLCYTLLDFSSKIAVSLILSRVQAADHWQTLQSLLKYLGNLNTGLMSILRANFDFVVPCVADSRGWCHVQSVSSRDIKEFGRVLGRDIAGLSLSELIAPQDQDHFCSYVQNSLDQAQKLELVVPEMPQSAHQAPVASVLQCNMLSWASNSSNEEDSNEDATQAAPRFVAVSVHLSVVQCAGPKKVAHVIAAFRLANDSTSPVPAAEENTMPLGMISDEGNQVGRIPMHEGSSQDESSEIELRKVCSSVFDACSQDTVGQGSTSTGGLSSKQSTAALNSGFDIEVGLEHGHHACFGGSDVGSQSSKLSCPNSVTAAFQQVLGPLHTGLPPGHLMPKAMEDYMQLATDMMRRKVPVDISRLHHQHKLAEWNAKKKAHSLSQILAHGRAPDENIEEHIWRSIVLPAVTEDRPGAKPVEPTLPDENELWHQSWSAVFEEDEEESDDERMASSMARSMTWQNYPARHVRSP